MYGGGWYLCEAGPFPGFLEGGEGEECAPVIFFFFFRQPACYL